MGKMSLPLHSAKHPSGSKPWHKYFRGLTEIWPIVSPTACLQFAKPKTGTKYAINIFYTFMCFLFHKNLRCDHNIKVHLLQEKCSKIEEETMFEQICFIKNISDLFLLDEWTDRNNLPFNFGHQIGFHKKLMTS